jgi:tRNA nucleotidyltransferase (CCA-adding enzyme)
MKLPESLTHLLDACRRAGGRPVLVGGCVRDWRLGLEPKDFDVEVFGLGYEDLARALSPVGRVDLVGRAFAVLKIRGDGWEYDFSLPRRDSKAGIGHRDFAVAADPGLTEEEAAARRDFTINALAWDPFSDRIIDPLGGERDLRQRVLRHTGPHFREDPLRVLRGFQFAARFNLIPAPETIAECRAISGEFTTLPAERVWMEWRKWAEQSSTPSLGLRFLHDTGWLAHFPQLQALVGCPQDPEWHPEGDVWVHSCHCCDAMASLPEWIASPPERRAMLLLAILCHDLGKPACTHREERNGVLRWISPGHEPAGGPPTEAFLSAMRVSIGMIQKVCSLVVNHLWHNSTGERPSDNAVRRLARRLHPATIEDLCLVLMSDHLGRPPLVKPGTAERIAELAGRAREMSLADCAPKPILMGRHLLAAGLKPDPRFKRILDRAFDLQIDGAFQDEAGALALLPKLIRETP